MKKIQIILIILILVSIITLVYIDKNKTTIINNPDLTKLKAIDCLPEQRNVDECIEIYQPVCGQVQVDCIKEPCYLAFETFANSCYACINERVISYTEGECYNQSQLE